MDAAHDLHTVLYSIPSHTIRFKKKLKIKYARIPIYAHGVCCIGKPTAICWMYIPLLSYTQSTSKYYLCMCALRCVTDHSDAFCVVELDGPDQKPQQTTVVKKSYSPEWNEALVL